MSADNVNNEAAGGIDSSSYGIIRQRLNSKADQLIAQTEYLDLLRRDTFGSIPITLLATERIATKNNCVPRDLAPVGNGFLFGFNVQLHLRSETQLEDVFAAFTVAHTTSTDTPISGGRELQDADLSTLIQPDENLRRDFSDLYKYYKAATFQKFSFRGPYLYALFRVGNSTSDVKAFKWLRQDGGTLQYVDNRSAHEVGLPPQHELEWIRTNRDMQRRGKYSHISIDDRIFIETTGGDLTIKVEDNTATGEGIYSEPVDHPDQTLDDAEIYYALVGNLILLKVRPYQEQNFRYIVYSEKIHAARRIDAISQSCVQLPEDHGIIFPNGYFLQTGDYKQFDFAADNFEFRRRMSSPNGEDTLFVFHNPNDGRYCLLFYNLITQHCDSPLVGNGFSLFDDGALYLLRAQSEPQKIHAVQHWQTPCHVPGHEVKPANANLSHSPLSRFGNREVVRALAAVKALINLCQRDDAYDGLYVDIVHDATVLLDQYPWLSLSDCGSLDQPILGIKEAAQAAIAEFDKVVRMRRHAALVQTTVKTECAELFAKIARQRFDSADAHTTALQELRLKRGQLLSLRDTPFIQVDILTQLETDIVTQITKIAASCADFLAQPDALKQYHDQAATLTQAAENCEKTADIKIIETDASNARQDLELLLDTINTLDIEDSTIRTEILDSLAQAQSALAATRGKIQKRRNILAEHEGQAEFAAEMRVLNASVIGSLDSCTTPENCDSQLVRQLVQLEALEGRFGEFAGFLDAITIRREEVEAAFAAKRLQLLETRNRRTEQLHRSAERILKGIRTNCENIDDSAALLAYLAGDVMVQRVRDLAQGLRQLGDTVKAEDLETKLKNLAESSLHQLRDRQELHVAGEQLIKLGNKQFHVSKQAFDITYVEKNDQYCLHLTGTSFFEPCDDSAIVSQRDLWNCTSPAESATVYRGEYLAYQLYKNLSQGQLPSLAVVSDYNQEQRSKLIRQFIETRYEEGYVKGVHDVDAEKILATLVRLGQNLGLLSFDGRARMLARLSWQLLDRDHHNNLRNFAAVCGIADRVFTELGQATPQVNLRYPDRLIVYLERTIQDTATRFGSWTTRDITPAANYLAEWLSVPAALTLRHPTGFAANTLLELFKRKYAAKWTEIDSAIQSLKNNLPAAWASVETWVRRFALELGNDQESTITAENTQLTASNLSTTADHKLDRDEIRLLQQDAVIIEAAGLLLFGAEASVGEKSALYITDLVGEHAKISHGRLFFDYGEFIQRLRDHEENTVPRFLAFQQRKLELAAEKRQQMRISELRPQSLASFVRNQLIDQVYLPLIGDNLAKQLGAAGDSKSADRSGLLLLISPPGYGKTTLMEYIASCLGLAMMKINCPALGRQVESLDPGDAPNATSREELRRLVLALEMGDNVMLYLDDIQHCSSEFLQKFIPLCDASRRVEAVYNEKAKTYDLRGRRFCIVMAGNPYTESGAAFKIPDMLANRADTYNLGDIVGNAAEAFKLSYIENAITSNPVLRSLTRRDHHDIIELIDEAATGQPADLKSSATPDQIGEWVATIKHLLKVRDAVLAVNQAYITSAAQEENYRREPPFKLQGSYRNMARMAEKVLPLMNAGEVETLIISHYEQEAQTLAAAAEANLLKFREIRGLLTVEQEERWEEIKRSFMRVTALRGADENDRLAQAVMLLGSLGEAVQQVASAVKFSQSNHNVRQIAFSQEGAAAISSLLQANQPPALPSFPDTLALSDSTVSAIQQGCQSLEKSAQVLVSTLGQQLSEVITTFQAALPDKKVYQFRLPNGILPLLDAQQKQVLQVLKIFTSPGYIQGLTPELRQELTAGLQNVVDAYSELQNQLKAKRDTQGSALLEG